MKRTKFLFFCCIAVFLLMACGSSSSENEEEKISVTGADGKEYTSYQTACANGDFDAARNYIGKMKEKLVEIKSEGTTSAQYALNSAIEEAEKYIFNEEVQYLASLNEEQASNRVILIMNQRPIEGVEAAEMSCLAKGVLQDYRFEQMGKFREYITWCGNHNSRLNTLLSIAISCGNQSLAKKILISYRPDPEMVFKNERYKDGIGTVYDVYAHYTNTSKDAAKIKYDEAVKSGAFNE